MFYNIEDIQLIVNYFLQGQTALKSSSSILGGVAACPPHSFLSRFSRSDEQRQDREQPHAQCKADRGSGVRQGQGFLSNSIPCWTGAAQGNTSDSALHRMPSARETPRVGRAWFCICVQCSVHWGQSRKKKLHTSSTVHILTVRPAAYCLWTHILVLSIENLMVNVFSLIQLKWACSFPVPNPVTVHHIHHWRYLGLFSGLYRNSDLVFSQARKLHVFESPDKTHTLSARAGQAVLPRVHVVNWYNETPSV